MAERLYPRSRLDALSDAVFGVAMTLLVLDVRLPEEFRPSSAWELVNGLLALWQKFFPYVLSFLVLGLRWLSNVQLRTRSEWFGREYAVWWLLYLLLVTCVPFTTMVVGRHVMFAPAIWLYAGNTLLIVAVAFRLLALTEVEPGDHRRSADIAVCAGALIAACDRLEFRQSTPCFMGISAQCRAAGYRAVEAPMRPPVFRWNAPGRRSRASVPGVPLSLTLADLGGVRERVLHAMPDMLRNFDMVSARPRHERNLMYPYFPAHHRNGVAEGREGLWIPCGGSDLQFLGLGEIVRE